MPEAVDENGRPKNRNTHEKDATMITVETLSDLKSHVGEDLGSSDWMLINQETINRFSEITGDRNWYHIDADRARHELPGGRTIAHGLLTLSLIPGLASQIVRVLNHGRALNYGLNKVRFPTTVPVDSRLRLKMTVAGARSVTNGLMLTRLYTMELEGSQKPAMIAEMLTLIFDQPISRSHERLPLRRP
ncbi:MaoC family dehydratase [Paraburkholderia sp. RL17-347-BIC-D]|uniref:MaoC family dehydratase n=1 Tax=Paraburkholderia sp. RL17-347-BIC-D TaxID=3031632 RepID=UPI0038BB7698